MSKIKNNVVMGNPDFDWTPYEDGWNGKSLKTNKKFKHSKQIKVYSHEPYAQEALNKYLNQVEPVSKELHKNTLVKITGLRKVDADHVSATISGGANNIFIDLNKEQKFFNTISVGNDKLTKETFLELLEDPEIQRKFIEMNLTAKIGTDIEKGSIWDGCVESLVNEMREQTVKQNKAYIAEIMSSNNGGFVVEVAGTIKAFMPGSMAAANKLVNYESLVGTKMEVMVESYDPKFGFIVSRKKYLRTIIPIYLNRLETAIAENKDYNFNVTVTGTTQFGIFCEINEVLTGMIHKSLMSDSLRDRLRNGEVAAQETLSVYVHRIERTGNNTRIVLSDVPSAERDAVIARREAEDLQEKSDYMAAKQREQVKADEAPAKEPVNKETSSEAAE